MFRTVLRRTKAKYFGGSKDRQLPSTRRLVTGAAEQETIGTGNPSPYEPNVPQDTSHECVPISYYLIRKTSAFDQTKFRKLLRKEENKEVFLCFVRLFRWCRRISKLERW